MTITRQHIGIGAAHCARQQLVLDRAAIDEKVLVVGHAAIVGRQPRNAGQVRIPAHGIDRHAVFCQFARNKPCHAAGQRFIALHRDHPAPIVLQHEADVGPRHCEAAHNILTRRPFGARRAQELAPRRYFAEEVLHPDARSRWKRGGSVIFKHTMIDHPLPALLGAMRTALDRQPRDRSDRRQGFATETQRRHQFNMFVGQLGRGVPFKRQRHLVGRHAAAIVGHLDQVQPARGKTHGDLRRPRVDRILDQFLERRCRALDHLACGDAIDEMFRKATNCGHEVLEFHILS